MTMAAIDTAAPEKVFTRKSSSVLGYASNFRSFENMPPSALAQNTGKFEDTNQRASLKTARALGLGASAAPGCSGAAGHRHKSDVRFWHARRHWRAARGGCAGVGAGASSRDHLDLRRLFSVTRSPPSPPHIFPVALAPQRTCEILRHVPDMMADYLTRPRALKRSNTPPAVLLPGGPAHSALARANDDSSGRASIGRARYALAGTGAM